MSYLPIPECWRGVRLVAAVTLRWQRSLAQPPPAPRTLQSAETPRQYLHPHLTLTLANIFIDISDSYHQST